MTEEERKKKEKNLRFVQNKCFYLDSFQEFTGNVDDKISKEEATKEGALRNATETGYLHTMNMN